MTNNDILQLARVIKNAIAIRENSYWDEQPRGYSKSIRQAVDEAFETSQLPNELSDLVYMLLNSNWNEAQNWAIHYTTNKVA